MPIVQALLTNGAYGYPRGAARRHRAHILAVVHQTATTPADGQAMRLRNARNAAGYNGNTATWYIDPHPYGAGSAVHAVDGHRFASWCSAPQSINYVDATKPWMATVKTHFGQGFNPNECTIEQFECVGNGTEPWTEDQFRMVAELIAAASRREGIPISRATVVPHRDFDTVNRPSDPWPASIREARLAKLISMAQAAYAGAPAAGGTMGLKVKLAATATTATPWTSFGTAKVGAAATTAKRVADAGAISMAAGLDLGVVQKGTLVAADGTWPAGAPVLVTNVAGEEAAVLASAASFAAIAPPSADTWTAAEQAKLNAAVAAQQAADQAAIDAANAKVATAAAAEKDRIAKAAGADEEARIRGL